MNYVCISILARTIGGGARFVCCMEALPLNSCMERLGPAPSDKQVIPCHDQRSVLFPSLSSPLCDVGWPSLIIILQLI